MSIYVTIRDWVDRCLTGSNYKLPLLPVVLLFVPAMIIGGEVLQAVAGIGFVLWSAFVMWRWGRQMREALAGRSAFGIRGLKSKKIKNG